jgi:hypothetical protein
VGESGGLLLGAGDERSWERVFYLETAVTAFFPGPMPEPPVCDFCAHLDGVETTEVVGYYLVHEYFVVHEFFPAGTDGPPRIAPLVDNLRVPAEDAPGYPARNEWWSPPYFFACPGHAQAIEADPRHRDRPPLPDIGRRQPTGVIAAFFACRTSGLMSVQPETPYIAEEDPY